MNLILHQTPTISI